MPESGTLSIRVFTGRGQIPVESASVAVVQQGRDGRSHLLSLQTTDQSGNVPSITIAAPDLENSQSPGQPTAFALCDVFVEHLSYELLVIRNVQIFPGITSLQEMPLIPRPEEFGDSSGSSVDIPAQDL